MNPACSPHKTCGLPDRAPEPVIFSSRGFASCIRVYSSKFLTLLASDETIQEFIFQIHVFALFTLKTVNFPIF